MSELELFGVNYNHFYASIILSLCIITCVCVCVHEKQKLSYKTILLLELIL